jgi:hypothetical protein
MLLFFVHKPCPVIGRHVGYYQPALVVPSEWILYNLSSFFSKTIWKIATHSYPKRWMCRIFGDVTRYCLLYGSPPRHVTRSARLGSALRVHQIESNSYLYITSVCRNAANCVCTWQDGYIFASVLAFLDVQQSQSTPRISMVIEPRVLPGQYSDQSDVLIY